MSKENRFFNFIVSIFLILISHSEASWAQQSPIWRQQAQAVAPNVLIYTAPDFDSEVVKMISPGRFYWITEKPEGPFYKIRLSKTEIGYVPDTELNIKGKGAFQPKPFAEDEPDEDLVEGENQKPKKSTAKKKKQPRDEEESDYSTGQNYFGVSLVNYQENTLGGVQVGDVVAFNYKRLPWQSDETAFGLGLIAWDVMAAFSAPAYYEKKTGKDASGFILWGGMQAQNFSPINSLAQFRYGMGPFVKFSSFTVQTAPKNYSLQDLTLGIALEGALQLTLMSWGLDVGLRYNWDKTPYGALTLGVLF